MYVNHAEMAALIFCLQAWHTFDLETPWEVRAVGSQNEILRHERAQVLPIVLHLDNTCPSAVNCVSGRMSVCSDTSTVSANVDSALLLP